MKKVLLAITILLFGFILLNLFRVFISPKLYQNMLSRNYPDFIKCYWISDAELSTVSGRLDELRQRGLNTICVMVSVPEYSFHPKLFEIINIPFTQHQLASIKRQGFAIFLAVEVAGLEAPGRKLDQASLDEFLQNSQKAALSWAKFAEDYQIEYFAPQSEFNSRLDAPPAWFDQGEARSSQIAAVNNQWHQQMLSKLRQIYHGKLVAKFGSYQPGLSAKGYDLVGVTIEHRFVTDLDKIRTKLREVYQSLIAMAKETNDGWLVSEAFFPSDEPAAAEDIRNRYQQADYRSLQDDYFRISFEEIDKLPPNQQPKGYAATGYGPGANDLLTPAAQEQVKTFFSRH